MALEIQLVQVVEIDPRLQLTSEHDDVEVGSRVDIAATEGRGSSSTRESRNLLPQHLEHAPKIQRLSVLRRSVVGASGSQGRECFCEEEGGEGERGGGEGEVVAWGVVGGGDEVG